VPFLKVFVVNNKWGATPTLQNMRRVVVGSTLPSHAQGGFLGPGGMFHVEQCIGGLSAYRFTYGEVLSSYRLTEKKFVGYMEEVL